MEVRAARLPLDQFSASSSPIASGPGQIPVQVVVRRAGQVLHIDELPAPMSPTAGGAAGRRTATTTPSRTPRSVSGRRHLVLISRRRARPLQELTWRGGPALLAPHPGGIGPWCRCCPCVRLVADGFSPSPSAARPFRLHLEVDTPPPSRTVWTVHPSRSKIGSPRRSPTRPARMVAREGDAAAPARPSPSGHDYARGQGVSPRSGVVAARDTAARSR